MADCCAASIGGTRVLTPLELTGSSAYSNGAKCNNCRFACSDGDRMGVTAHNQQAELRPRLPSSSARRTRPSGDRRRAGELFAEQATMKPRSKRHRRTGQRRPALRFFRYFPTKEAGACYPHSRSCSRFGFARVPQHQSDEPVINSCSKLRSSFLLIGGRTHRALAERWPG